MLLSGKTRLHLLSLERPDHTNYDGKGLSNNIDNVAKDILLTQLTSLLAENAWLHLLSIQGTQHNRQNMANNASDLARDILLTQLTNLLAENAWLHLLSIQGTQHNR